MTVAAPWIHTGRSLPAAPRWPFVFDDSSPFGGDVRACWVSGPGYMVDIIDGRIGTIDGNATIGAPEDGLAAQEMRFDGVSDSWVPNNQGTLINEGTRWTVAWCSYLTSFVDAFPEICALVSDSVSVVPLVIGYSNNASYQDIFFGVPGTWHHNFTLPSPLSPTAERHWGVISYNGGTATVGSSYSVVVNGLACTHVASPSLGGVTNENRIGRSSNVSTDWNGGIFAVLVAGREWARSVADAWFDPATRWTWALEYGRRNYFFVDAAPAGARPQGPLGHPLAGALGGPI